MIEILRSYTAGAGAEHFFQSKTHTPIVDEGGPKGIQEQVSETLQAAGVREAQEGPPLEHCIIGIGTSRTGMHQPGAVLLKAEPHHWQHLVASHSSAVARVQLSLGTGGEGGIGAEEEEKASAAEEDDAASN